MFEEVKRKTQKHLKTRTQKKLFHVLNMLKKFPRLKNLTADF